MSIGEGISLNKSPSATADTAMFLPIFLAGVNPCGLSAWIAKMEACRSCLGTAAETRLRSGVTGRAKELLMPSRTKSISKVKTRPPFWGNY